MSIFNESLTTSLTVSDTVPTDTIRPLDTSISITDETVGNQRFNESLTEELTFVNTAEDQPHTPVVFYIAVATELEFDESFERTIPASDLVTKIDVYQTARLVKEATASTSVSFTNTTCRGESIDSSITFSDSAVGFYGTPCSTQLTVSDTVAVTKILGIAVSTSVSVTGQVGGYLNLSAEQQVSYESGPRSKSENDVVFNCKGDTLTLRAPLFGNVEAVEVFKNINFSRHGTPLHYRDPLWPINTKLRVRFDNLTKTERDAIETFVRANVGQEMTYTDHEGITWPCMLTNPNLVFAERSACNYAVEFELTASEYSAEN